MGMKYYTQNDEERVILSYFGNYVGALVDIGSNDGTTFSNSARLIELGWKAYLIEPHKEAFQKCVSHYKGNPNVHMSNVAIGDSTKDVKFHAGSDSMLSSVHEHHKAFWPTTQFEERTVAQFSWTDFARINKIKEIDFISIDAEGCDWDILQQIDLSNVKMICIEVGEFKDSIIRYCLHAGMRQVHRTFENLIFAR